VIVTDNRVARYVSQKIGRGLCPPFTCMGIEKDGEIVCGAIFNNFTGYDMELTIASERGAITRAFLVAMGKYVRDTNRCGRVSITTEQPLVAAMAKRLGGKVEGVKRNFFGPGRDATILGIIKSEWRFPA